ncbi:hypothetical protein [Acinetobacter baylyi]|uniref:hypothetical protein n=2 Tax=Acinetobacter baylyi TaxID=202950 RepID=UPI0002F8A108|nr:hypothetical protein [Acinetobacter baylyi]
MRLEDFVAELQQSVINENSKIYKEFFNNTTVEQATDPYWKNALKWFNALPDNQHDVFFAIIQQIMVDTISNVLGILDDMSECADTDSELLLSGDLQNLFLCEQEQLQNLVNPPMSNL